MYNVNPKYNSDILDYCKLNNIDDVELFVSQCFKQGFDIKKYGLLGKTLNEGEKDLIKEVIVEKLVEVPVDRIVEVPVEVIVEKEKIVEVPVEVIIEKEVIKEVPIEKVVTKVEYISNKTTEDELGGIIAELKNEMSKKDEKLDELRRSLDIALDKPPVEIIKEVEVIKEVERSNDKVIMLQDTLQKLRSEMKDKNTEIDSLKGLIKQLESRLNPTGAVYMKGSNINENL
jgi:hypothetical protein